MRKAKLGFTLVELLVVIAIIGVLVSLLLPAVQAAREAARRTQCANNIRQLAVALHNYHDTVGRFPPGGIYYSTNAWPNPNSTSWRASWITMLLPQLEQQGLYDLYDFSVRFTDAAALRANNLEVVGTRIPTLVCPSIGTQQADWHQGGSTSRIFAKGNYGACFSSGSAFSATSFKGTRMDIDRAVFNAAGRYGAQLADIKDGTSNVVAVAEILTRDHERDGRGAWGYPTGAFFSGGNQLAITDRDATKVPNGNAVDDRFVDEVYECSSPTTDTLKPRLRCVEGQTRPNIAARSYHPGGVHAILCDGSVKFINDSIDAQTWRRLLCIHDGEPIDQY